MKNLKKLWFKSRFYSNLITASFLLNLSAIGIIGAILVFATPLVPLAVSISASIAVFASTVALNFWIWSNPSDMSDKAWEIEFSNPRMLEVILSSFSDNQQKFDFLNQKDRLGHTALTGLAFQATAYSYLAADNDKSEKQKTQFQARAQDCMDAITYILSSGIDSQILMNLPDKKGDKLWNIIIRPARPNPELLDKVLNCLTDEQKIHFISAQHSPQGSRTHLPNAFHYVLYYIDQKQPQMTAILNSMLTKLPAGNEKIQLLSEQTNDSGWTVIEQAIIAGNYQAFKAITTQLLNANASEHQKLLTGNNNRNINLFRLAAEQGHIEIIRDILEFNQFVTPKDIHDQLAQVIPLEERTFLEQIVFKDQSILALTPQQKQSYQRIVDMLSLILSKLSEDQRAALILTPRPIRMSPGSEIQINLLEQSIMGVCPLAAKALFDSLSPENKPTIEQLRAHIKTAQGKDIDDPRIETILLTLSGQSYSEATGPVPPIQAEPAPIPTPTPVIDGQPAKEKAKKEKSKDNYRAGNQQTRKRQGKPN